MNEILSARHETPLTQRVMDGFVDVLAPYFVLEQLESHPASIFGLLSGGYLAYVNPSWMRFARENGVLAYDPPRPWISQRYLDVIAEPLKPFYANLFERAQKQSSMHPVSHVYECSTPDTFRQFVMKVYALPHAAGFVVINSLIISRPHDVLERVPQLPNRELYESAEGLILQCSHCRLIRRADQSRWDWVPAWVEQMPPGTSHGVCDVCFEYYYPDDDHV